MKRHAATIASYIGSHFESVKFVAGFCFQSLVFNLIFFATKRWVQETKKKRWIPFGRWNLFLLPQKNENLLIYLLCIIDSCYAIILKMHCKKIETFVSIHFNEIAQPPLIIRFECCFYYCPLILTRASSHLTGKLDRRTGDHPNGCFVHFWMVAVPRYIRFVMSGRLYI